MYAGTRLGAAARGRRGGLGRLAGVFECAGVFSEMGADGCMHNYCIDTDMQTGEQVGEPYPEPGNERNCQTYVDARSETVNVPGAVFGEGTTVTYQERTEYVVPMGSQAPAPDSPEWDAWVEAARAGTLYQNVVSASSGTGEGAVFVPAGTFDPATDYVPGYDPRTGERYAPGEDPGAPSRGGGPTWWEAAAYGGAGAELAPLEAERRAPVLPLLAGGLLLFAVTRRRRR